MFSWNLSCFLFLFNSSFKFFKFSNWYKKVVTIESSPKCLNSQIKVPFIVTLKRKINLKKMQLFGAIKIICLIIVLITLGSNAQKRNGSYVSRHQQQIDMCFLNNYFISSDHASVNQAQSAKATIVYKNDLTLAFARQENRTEAN